MWSSARPRLYQSHTRSVPVDSADPTEKDFVQHVLSWPLKELKNPLSHAERLPQLPRRSSSPNAYYNQFLPFILEESHAAIAAGLEAAHHRKIRAFSVTLTEDVTPPRTPGNPCTIKLRGTIPADQEYSASMNVLLLTHRQGRDQNIAILALASVNFDSREIKAKAVIFSSTLEEKRSIFIEGQRWEATYLTSLVTQQRMFEACTKKIGLECLSAIVTAQISPLPRVYHAQAAHFTADLNASQQHTVQGFLAASSGIYLLQGPPGTGKTTTIESLLAALSTQRTRVLVCAPSNKAVQVLAERFLEKHPHIPMILAGVESKVPEHLRPIFLHNWKKDLNKLLTSTNNVFSAILDFATKSETTLEEIQEHFSKKLDTTKKTLQGIQSQFTKYDLLTASGLEKMFQYIAEIEAGINTFNARKSTTTLFSRSQDVAAPWKQEIIIRLQALIKLISTIQTKFVQISSEELETCLLNKAQIVFATLSVSGRHQMLKMNNVDILIVDEAGQSVEAETLIALQHNPKKILLVGDTKQLPATVISQIAKAKNFDRSMMQRLEDNDQPCAMLDTQYRMHPEICEWPSNRYYQGQLVTAPELIPSSSRTPRTQSLTQPLAFYDIRSNERSYGHSYQNDQEAHYVIECIRRIRATDQQSSIGVITFYAAQVSAIEAMKRHNKVSNGVTVNTVDGFQGDERDIIIVSCVRSNSKGSIGFVEDFRRLNVAMTRAKNTLIVLGNACTLERSSSDLTGMLNDLKCRGLYFTENNLKGHLGMVAATPRPQTGNASAALFTLTTVSRRDPRKSQKKPAAQPVCRFYTGVANSCRKGKDCNFSHAL